MAKTWKGRKALGTGHVRSSLERMSSEPANLTPLLNHVCEHEEYCSVRKTLNKAHCSKDYAKNCQTAKFYLRYGKDFDQLGVGS